MGRVSWGGSGAPSTPAPAAPPGGSRVSWSAAPHAPAGPSPIEQKVINSFMSLPQNERNLTYNRLVTAAKGGDSGATRKLQLLTPKLNENAPTDSNYADNSLSGKLYRASQGLAQGLIDPFVGGSAGEDNVQRNTSGRVTSFDAGKQVSQRDIALKGIEARLLVAGGEGAAAAKGGELAAGASKTARALNTAKTVAKAGNKAGLYNAGATTVGSLTSDNIDNVAAPTFGGTIANVGKQAAGAYATGAALGGGAKVVGKIASSAARYINNPIEEVAVQRISAAHPDLATGGKTTKAAFYDKVNAEVKSIKGDPVQKQAIAQAYHQGGIKGLSAETGYHPDAVKLAKNAAAVDHQFQAGVQGLADRFGETAKAGPPKTVGRIHEKATNDYGGDVSRVQDATRATITVKDPTKIQDYIKAIGDQYPVTRVKEPTSTGFYRDTKVNVTLPSGHTGEIILASPEMLAAKSEVHSIYKQLRSKNTLSADEYSQLENTMNQRFSEATKAEEARLNSVDVSGRPSMSALAGGNGRPRAFTADTLPRPSDVTVTGTSSTSKNLGNDVKSGIGESPSIKNVAQNAKNVNIQQQTNKAIAQNVDETLATPDATSRVNQYEKGLQDTIAGIEKAPGYQAELAAKGGGEVISNKETYAKALKAGPLDNETIKNWQAGEPVDSVTLVRAKATLNAEAQSFTDKWQKGGLDPVQLDAAAKELAQLEAGYHVMSAEPGRATQIQASFVDKEYQKAQALKKLVVETKGPNKEAIIKKGIDEFAKAAEAQEKSGIFSKEIAKKLTDMLAEYATAAKLTSPLTHAVNIASNLLTLPQRAAENVVSTGWEALRGRTSLEQAKYVFGTSQGLKTAATQLVSDLKQAINPKAPDLGLEGGKTESRGPAIPGVAGKIIRTPFNFLSAADNFFKNVLRDSEIHQQAFAAAFKEGHTGKALADRVSELVNNPTPEMVAQSEKAAKEFTFQADPGPLSKGISQMLGKVPLLRLLIPFVQTPTNLAKFQIQRTPLGIFAPRNITALVKGSSIERSQAIARLAVGTGMSIAGVAATLNAGDNIVGAAPTNPGEKDNFYNSGKKPYSIKIGGSWVQYNRFQPIGMYLTQAVNLRDALLSGNSKTAGNIFTSLAVGTAKGIADLPFVSGVNNVITALNDTTNQTAANKAIGGLITGLIPNVGRDIASAGDTTQRSAKTITDQVKLMVPGLRQQVAPRGATFGGTQDNAGSPLQRGFLKIVSPDQSTDLTKTLDEIGQNTGYYPQPPARNTKVRGKVLDDNTYAKYEDLSGRKLRSKLQTALNDAAFVNANPDEQQKTLQTMVADARIQAQVDLFGAAPKTKPAKVKHY